MLAAWSDALEQMNRRCDEAVDRLREEEFERLVDAEQAKVDALHGPLKAAAERDVWPKHLYLSSI